MASCLDALGLESGWCGHGACVNASADGQGAAGCVCDSGWALERRLVNPGASAPRCTISLVSLRVLNAVLMALTLLLAALTARSILLGRLGRRRGCVTLLGQSIIFSLTAAALARGPEATASGVAWPDILFFLSYYCVSCNVFVALDKYVKAVKGSASGQARVGGPGGSLEHETVGALTRLAALWVVLATLLVAVDWPSDAAFYAAELVYAVLVTILHARQVHVVLKALDSDLAFVAGHALGSDVIDKIHRLRRKSSRTRSFVVRTCLFLALLCAVVLLFDISPSGPPVWEARDELQYFGCLVMYLSLLAGHLKTAPRKRNKDVHALQRNVIASTKADSEGVGQQ